MPRICRARCTKPRRRRVFVIAAALATEALPVLLRAHRLGGNIVVRCRDGHLFTTIWIPGVSVKALRLGWWRVQRCPVGPHWTIVTPAKQAGLTDEQRRAAANRHDIRLP